MRDIIDENAIRGRFVAGSRVRIRAKVEEAGLNLEAAPTTKSLIYVGSDDLEFNVLTRTAGVVAGRHEDVDRPRI